MRLSGKKRDGSQLPIEYVPKRRKLNHSHTESTAACDEFIEYEQFLDGLLQIISVALECYTLWKKRYSALGRSLPTINTLHRQQTTIRNALSYNKSANYEELRRAIATVRANIPKEYKQQTIKMIKRSHKNIIKYFENNQLSNVSRILTNVIFFRQMMSNKLSEPEIIILSDDDDDDDLDINKTGNDSIVILNEDLALNDDLPVLEKIMLTKQNHISIMQNVDTNHTMVENETIKTKLIQKESECKQLNTEIIQLKKQLLRKEGNINTLKNVLGQINKKHTKELNKLQRELNKVRIIASSLQNNLITGHEPRRQFIISIKSEDSIERTEKVADWKNEIYESYRNNVISRYHQAITPIMNMNIGTFLKRNINDKQYTNPVTTLNNLSLNDVAQRYTITAAHMHRVPALIGQEGVRCVVDIPKDTVLARYVGFEMTNNEWNDCFDYSNKDGFHGQYLYTFNLDVNNNVSDARSITIDPIEGGKQQLLALYINDCREDIYVDKLSEEDKKHMNCTFVVVRIYGWPTVFVIASRKIKKGEELLLDYGKDFWYSIKQNNRWNNIIQKVRNLSQQNIIKNVKLYETHNGIESHDLTV